MSEELPSVKEVVGDLGGVAETARLLGCGETAVHNMVRRNAFPARTFFRIRDELVARGLPVPEALWQPKAASEGAAA